MGFEGNCIALREKHAQQSVGDHLQFFRLVQKRDDPFAIHGRKAVQELIDGIARFEIIEQGLHWNTCSGENRSASHDFRIARDDLLLHSAIIPKAALSDNARHFSPCMIAKLAMSQALRMPMIRRAVSETASVSKVGSLCVQAMIAAVAIAA